MAYLCSGYFWTKFTISCLNLPRKLLRWQTLLLYWLILHICSKRSVAVFCVRQLHRMYYKIRAFYALSNFWLLTADAWQPSRRLRRRRHNQFVFQWISLLNLSVTIWIILLLFRWYTFERLHVFDKVFLWNSEFRFTIEIFKYFFLNLKELLNFINWVAIILS